MKAALLIAALLAAAIAIWRPQTPSFEQRFIQMPPAMSWDTISRARKASQHPAFCQWNYPGSGCRVS